MKRAAAALYKRREMLIVEPTSTTTAGVGIGTAPIETFPDEISSELLGEAVLRALEAARTGVPHPGPDEWAAIAKPLYEAAGVKSWGAFVKGAVYCHVTRDDANLYIEPSRNLGARGGFQPIPGQDGIEIPALSSAEEIGNAVREALSISR